MKKWKRAVTLLLVFVLFIISSLTVYATSSTSDMIKQKEQEKKDTESDLQDTKDQIDDLKNQKGGLETDLNNLNSELSKVNDKIEELSTQITAKEEEIRVTQEELEAARQTEEEQYEAMKKRIQYMYEHRNTSMLEILVEADGVADLLNRADYYTQMASYDRAMLEKFQHTKADIAQKEVDLTQEQADLESLKEEADQQQKKIQTLVDNTSNKISQYKGMISDAEQKAEEYEQQIQQQEGTLDELRQKYEQELEIARRAREQDKNNPNSDYVIDPGSDLAALAAIIECEAGGESYEGKIGVANVVLNRVRSGSYPNTVMAVITQPRQFTPVSSGRFYMVLERGAAGSCIQAAQDALNGTNTVGDALYFRTVIPGIDGQIIRNHIFY